MPFENSILESRMEARATKGCLKLQSGPHPLLDPSPLLHCAPIADHLLTYSLTFFSPLCLQLAPRGPNVCAWFTGASQTFILGSCTKQILTRLRKAGLQGRQWRQPRWEGEAGQASLLAQTPKPAPNRASPRGRAGRS